jgi:hypothetical protein
LCVCLCGEFLPFYIYALSSLLTSELFFSSLPYVLHRNAPESIALLRFAFSSPSSSLSPSSAARTFSLFLLRGVHVDLHAPLLRRQKTLFYIALLFFFTVLLPWLVIYTFGREYLSTHKPCFKHFFSLCVCVFFRFCLAPTPVVETLRRNVYRLLMFWLPLGFLYIGFTFACCLFFIS